MKVPILVLFNGKASLLFLIKVEGRGRGGGQSGMMISVSLDPSVSKTKEGE